MPPIPDLSAVFQCSSCREVKGVEEFYADRSSPRGHKARCKQCDKEARGTYRRGVELCRDCGASISRSASRCRACSYSARSAKAVKRAEERLREGFKACFGCGQAQPLESFRPSSKTLDSLPERGL